MKNDLTAQVESAIATARKNMNGDKLTPEDSQKLHQMMTDISAKIKELQQASHAISSFFNANYRHDYS